MEQSVNVEEAASKKMDEENEISDISEIIENSDIEEDDKERIISIIQREEFRGPIPHPQILKQYEEIQAGLAKEIVNMAVKEQNHRHEVEKSMIESEILLNKTEAGIVKASISLKSRLQIFGFFSTTILLIAGITCIFLDKNIGSITSFVLAIGSFCWTMFYGKKDNSAERENADSE